MENDKFAYTHFGYPHLQSTPRPQAKTSLGFYPDINFDNVSDNEEENVSSVENPQSTETSEGSSGEEASNGEASSPKEPEFQQPRDCAFPIQPQAFHPQPPPQPQLPNIASLSLLDQNTLQQLMLNPQLLRQLNEWSTQLHYNNMQSTQSAQPQHPHSFQQQVW